MSSSIKEKLKKIPEKYKRLIVSEKSIDFSVLICKKHNIINKELAKKFDLILLGLFFKEFLLVDLVSIIQKELGFSPEASKALALDIAGMSLLIVDDWLGNEVGPLIKSLGGRVEDYLKYVEENKTATKEEYDLYDEQKKKEELDFKDIPLVSTAEGDEKEGEIDIYQFNLEKEKEDTVKNFREIFSTLLAKDNYELAEEYNNILLQILIDGDESAKDDLEKALYANQEKLTSAVFEFEKKPAAPTVGNWLKYFIAVKGSQMFDNIVLSDFIINAPNTKLLKEAEKSLVRKLLIVYRNVKFFPESMPNQTGDNWEIIPIEKIEEAKEKPLIVERKGITAEEKKIEELRKTLEKYPEGSLERRVVEGEIKKMKNKK